jgi:hypothetical protein
MNVMNAIIFTCPARKVLEMEMRVPRWTVADSDCCSSMKMVKRENGLGVKI